MALPSSSMEMEMEQLILLVPKNGASEQRRELVQQAVLLQEIQVNLCRWFFLENEPIDHTTTVHSPGSFAISSLALILFLL